MGKKKLSTDHTFILRLLDCGEIEIDGRTLLKATLGIRSHVHKILDDLLALNLVERKLSKKGLVYKRKLPARA